MEKDNKKLLKYLGIIFIATLLTYKLPHDSYSISEYLIPAIKNDNSVIYFSGLPALILYIIGIRGLFGLERYKERNKFLVFLGVIILVVPLMTWSIDATRTNYHWIKGDSLAALDIEESEISLNGYNGRTKIEVNLDLIDYGRGENKFKIRVYPPKSIQSLTDKEFYELENDYRTNGRRQITSIEEEINLSLSSEEREKIFESRWYQEDIVYELYNDKETIRIIDHGL